MYSSNIPSLPTKADISNRLLLDNVTPLRHVQTVKELESRESGKDVRGTEIGLKAGCSKLTLRISLLRTLQICWMSAALWETPSRELPESTSSSLTLVETAISTPGWAVTRRTYFSPKKLLERNPSVGRFLQNACSDKRRNIGPQGQLEQQSPISIQPAQ